ncbi:unnamed protein product [Protopolystoma xenopodis]|uniref:Uncharacterized protein n=1 Tax=Protopolystoma xenopodis TaxID=117903 RepID=A0A448WKQ7_9PLAT|nr:unnamed protein product [Protopolystoma xenopodis]
MRPRSLFAFRRPHPGRDSNLPSSSWSSSNLGHSSIVNRLGRLASSPSCSLGRGQAEARRYVYEEASNYASSSLTRCRLVHALFFCPADTCCQSSAL